jgi:hypothetical protein
MILLVIIKEPVLNVQSGKKDPKENSSTRINPNRIANRNAFLLYCVVVKMQKIFRPD